MIILIGSRLSYLWTVIISGLTVGCSQVRVSLRRRRNLFLGGKLWLGGGNSNILYFHPYLGKWSNLTDIFQMGWNHQLVDFGRCSMFFFEKLFMKEPWSRREVIRQTNWNGENTANIEYFEESARRSWKNRLVPLKINEYPPWNNDWKTILSFWNGLFFGDFWLVSGGIYVLRSKKLKAESKQSQSD